MTRQILLTAEVIADIAKVYDGRSETVSALMKKHQLARHNVHRGAALGL